MLDAYHGVDVRDDDRWLETPSGESLEVKDRLAQILGAATTWPTRRAPSLLDDNDVRVARWHSRKMLARLQTATKGRARSSW